MGLGPTHDPISLSPGLAPQAQDDRREPPLDGLGWSWRPRVCCSPCTRMARLGPEGSQERPWAHSSSAAGCSRPPVLRVPGTENPKQSDQPQGQSGSVSRRLPSSAVQLEARSRVKGSACLTLGTEARRGHHVSPAVSHRQGVLASFLVPTVLGSPVLWPLLHPIPFHPGPLLGTCQPADSICRSVGTACESHMGLPERRGGGASLGLIHRCAPFKPRSYPQGDLLPSCSLVAQLELPGA